MTLDVQLDFLRSDPATSARTAAAPNSWRTSLVPSGLLLVQLLLPFHLAPLYAAGLLLVVAVVEPRTRRLLLRRTPLDLPIALLLVAFAVSTISAPNDSLALRADAHVLAAVALFYLTANTVTSLRQMRSIAWALVVVACFTSAGAAFEKLDPPLAAPFFAALGGRTHYFPGHRLIRAAAGLSHPNVLGDVLAVAMVLLVGLILDPATGPARAGDRVGHRVSTEIRGPALAVVVYVFVQGLAFTYSRGGVAALLAGLAALILLALAGRSTRSRWRVAAGLAAVVAAFLAANVVGDPTFADRVASIVRPGYGPNHERMVLWRGAVIMARHHLLTGVGPENFGTIWGSPDAADADVQELNRIPGYHAHNLFLQLAACVGTLGVIAVAWFTLVTFFVGTRIVRCCAEPRLALFAAGCTAAAFAVFLHEQVDYLWHTPVTLLIFWLLPGLLVATDRLARGPAPAAADDAARAQTPHESAGI